MNMTVATTVATVVLRAERKAKMAMGRVAHLLRMLIGVRKMETKQVQAPVRKRENILMMFSQPLF